MIKQEQKLSHPTGGLIGVSSVTRVQPDVLQALDTRLSDISKAMRENRTIAAYELIRQLQEFVSYERAKHSAQ
jgi:hypothetical protein